MQKRKFTYLVVNANSKIRSRFHNSGNYCFPKMTNQGSAQHYSYFGKKKQNQFKSDSQSSSLRFMINDKRFVMNSQKIAASLESESGIALQTPLTCLKFELKFWRQRLQHVHRQRWFLCLELAKYCRWLMVKGRQLRDSSSGYPRTELCSITPLRCLNLLVLGWVFFIIK